MRITRMITAAVLAAGLTLGAAGAAFAYDEDDEWEGSYSGGPANNFAEGQNAAGPQHPPGCVKDFWGTWDCGPDSGQSFGPYDRQHAFERGDHILR